MTVRTHYANLQVAENASPEVIRGAYRYLSQKWHPDKNPDNRAEAERITQIINNAYEILSDPQQRRMHDLWIETVRRQNMRHHQEGGRSSTAVSEEEIQINFVQTMIFIKRAWLMSLFVLAFAAFLFGGYQLFAGHFQASYIVGFIFWLGIGRYAYASLFHPKVLDGEPNGDVSR